MKKNQIIGGLSIVSTVIGAIILNDNDTTIYLIIGGTLLVAGMVGVFISVVNRDQKS